MDLEKLWVYDIETYFNLFSFSIVRADGKMKFTFSCSKYCNEIERIYKCMDYLHSQGAYMVGFNSMQFDYPVMHDVLESREKFLELSGQAIARKVHAFAQKQIDSFKGMGFGRTISYEDQYVKQIDLFKIHHFDNKAKMTSLKMIEFNLRMQTLEDLPYAIEENLTEDQCDTIISYNEHDVEATRLFLHKSLDQVAFRFQLTEKYNKSFLNHNDTKIGSDYFIMELENSGVQMYEYKNGKRKMKQTIREKIKIEECLFDYYDFKRPEFIAIHNWFKAQVITETKGVFSDIEEHNLGEVAKYAEMEVQRKKFPNKPDSLDLAAFKRKHPMGWIEEEELKATEYLFDEEGNHVMETVINAKGKAQVKKVRVPKKSYYGCWKMATCLNVVIDGLRIDFGVGGIHASLSEKVVKETSKYFIRDADVSSMYPNIAISNRVYPMHLGETFCDIYKDMYEQRKSYKKGTAENAMLKLALNGTYGKSNDQYSVFYDPMFTMKITINGQLSLFMLAEKLLEIEDLKLIQLNTDGLTVACPRESEEQYNKVCADWQKQVGLELEFVDYSRMFIRDVNNYIAVYTNGKVKRKGAYQYEDLGWHQNQSALVIPMAAEAKMLHGTDIREFIMNQRNEFDFMLRTKVPRSSELFLVYEDGREEKQQNICRYYPSKVGGKLVKVMPPLDDDPEQKDRRMGIDKEWNVKTCNNMKDFKWDVDYDYYVAEAEKLVIN